MLSASAFLRARVCHPRQLVVTNTIAHNDRTMQAWSGKISQVSVAPLLAEAILRVEEGGSLQDLRVYDKDNVTERYLGQGRE
jgi:phosphoribosylpyrophosphate synthetase